MGNQMSVPQRVEDQENDSEADTHKVASGAKCGQNGTPVTVSTRSVQLDHEVDLETSVQEDNVATSSPKTMEISAVADANGKNLGKEAKPQTPAAKSRFFLTLSRPVPGRTGDQATDSSTGPVKLDVSSDKALGNKDPSEPMALPVAAALGCNPDKTPVQTPAQAEGLSATWGPESHLSESGGAAPCKPKDSSFFDRLFKLDKGRDKALVDRQQEAKRAEHQPPAAETPGFSTQSDDVPAERGIKPWIPLEPTAHRGAVLAGVSAETSVGRTTTAVASVSRKRKEADIADGTGKGQEIPTVSCSVPGVPEELEIAKEDPQTENNNSIMSFFKTLVSPNKAETKKDLEDTGAEKSPATSANLTSNKGNVTPLESQGAAKNSTSTDTAKEGAKEKGGPTSLPLGKLFWKKVEAVKSEEVGSALQTVDLSEEGDRTPEPSEETLKRTERRAQRPSLMALLRQMSVKGDGGITHSEEINGKDSSYQASEPPEKAVVPPESEPAAAGQKGKEGSSKDKKASADTEKQKSNKQEAKEPAPRAEPAPAEVNSLRDGDKSQKRLEKRRQPLGGFFKGLGPKRMLDAQVQTDPVSIGPVGKSK
ncbi:breast carcinoma-amplified sequence 1 isoform X5 [Kogia breviceps]|uniref:breast carcinoma-amplified sequence 1 isoform X5 n=1 Tax=Kogia breviceps TaxID=27615 RepID=UPI0034D2F8DE